MIFPLSFVICIGHSFIQSTNIFPYNDSYIPSIVPSSFRLILSFFHSIPSSHSFISVVCCALSFHSSILFFDFTFASFLLRCFHYLQSRFVTFIAVTLHYPFQSPIHSVFSSLCFLPSRNRFVYVISRSLVRYLFCLFIIYFVYLSFVCYRLFLFAFSNVNFLPFCSRFFQSL